MRSILMGTMVAACVTTMAGASSADGGTARIAMPTRPAIGRTLPVRIDGFRLAGQPLAYTGGSLAIAVDVTNDGDAPVNDVGVKLVVGGKTLEQSVSLPPRGRRTAIFSDTEGLTSSCAPKEYKLALAGPVTSVDGATREGTVTPSCVFKSTIEQTWNKMSPDKVEAEKAGNAYLREPQLVSSPSCTAGPTMKVKIVNLSPVNAPSLVVQSKDWAAPNQVKAQTAAAFPLAANEQKELLLTPVAGSTKDVSLRMKLTINDWSKSLGGRTSDGGIFINTSRACKLSFALD